MKLNHTNAQLCVWTGTIIGPENIAEFENWLTEEFGVTGEYAGEFETLPDLKSGEPVPGTGGRNDALFWIAAEDVPKFAVPRLSFGIRWWDDYLDNSRDIVPDRTFVEFSQSVFTREIDSNGNTGAHANQSVIDNRERNS
jgi:hypothetical protein